MTRLEHKKYFKSSDKYICWSAWVLTYQQYNYPKDLQIVERGIKSNLTIKLCPPKFRGGNMGNPLFGHCHHANQALYYFFADANFKVMSAPCDVAGQHWWCEDASGKIIDITADQYFSVGTKPPYDSGKKSMWYGWKNRPHRKTQKLMNAVQPTSKLLFEKYLQKP